ncbi:MAG: hypothetical protein ABEN55_20810, partial [Bradymonadaceae bacterium]
MVDLSSLSRQSESLLLQSYTDDPATVKQISSQTRDEVRDFVQIKRCQDPIGRTHFLVVLTPSGREVAAYLMVQHGYQAG